MSDASRRPDMAARRVAQALASQCFRHQPEQALRQMQPSPDACCTRCACSGATQAAPAACAALSAVGQPRKDRSGAESASLGGLPDNQYSRAEEAYEGHADLPSTEPLHIDDGETHYRFDNQRCTGQGKSRWLVLVS